MVKKTITVFVATVLCVGYFSIQGYAQPTVRYQPEGDKLEKQVSRPVKSTNESRPPRGGNTQPRPPKPPAPKGTVTKSIE